MKKKIYLFAAAALALASCSEEEMVQQNGTNQLRKMEITASMPDGDSRTVFKDGGIKWQANDALSVFVGGGQMAQFSLASGEGENEATFEGSASAGSAANNVAYYPYANNVSLTTSADGYQVSATFPTTQTWADDGSFGPNSLPMVAVTETTATTDKFQFKPLGAWLQLYVKGDTKITKVVMKAKDHKIAGNYTVTASYGAAPTMTMADDAVSYVALDCGEGVQLKSDEATLFTFAVAPFTFAADEVSFDLYDNEGKFMPNAYVVPKGGTVIANAYYTISAGAPIEYVGIVPPVQIGNLAYASLQDALAEVQKGGEIKVVQDMELAETITVPADVEVTIDLNGKTVAGTMHKSVGAVLKNEGTLTIKGGTISSTAGNGGSVIMNSGILTVENATLNGAPNAGEGWPSYAVNNIGTMTVTNSTITSCHGAVCSYAEGAVLTLNNTNIDMAGIPGFTSHGIYTYNGGKVVVNGGDIENKATDQNATGASVINGYVEVNAGNFKGRIENYYGNPVLKGGTYSVKPNANYVAEGYNVIPQGDRYVVGVGLSWDAFVQAVNAGDGTFDGEGKYVTIAVEGGDAREEGVSTSVPNRLQKYTNPEVYYAQYQRFSDLNDVKISNVNFVFVPAAVTVTDAWNTAGATTTKDNINGELQFMNEGKVTLIGCTFESMSVSPIKATSVEVDNCTFNGLDAYAIKDITAGTVTVMNSTFNDCNGGFWMNAAPTDLTVTDNKFLNVGRRGAMQFSAKGDYTGTAMTVTGNEVTGGAFLWQLNATVTYDQVSAILDTENNTYETAYVDGSTVPQKPIASVNGVQYTSFEDALDAVATNGGTGTVEVVAGEYTFPAAKLSEGVTLECAEGTVFTGSSSANINGATVVGAKFENESGTSLTGTVNGTFKECTFTGSNGLRWCYAGETSVFEDCVFDGDVYGAHFDGGSKALTFRRCTFSGFNAFGGAITMLTLEDCIFQANGKSNYNGVNLWGNTRMTGTQFLFDGSVDYEWVDICTSGITVEFTSCTVNGQPIQKNQVGGYAGEGYSTLIIDGNSYVCVEKITGLNAAIAKLSTEATVLLTDGTYEGHVDLTGKKLTLEAANKGQAIIKGSVWADNYCTVTLKGLKLTNPDGVQHPNPQSSQYYTTINNQYPLVGAYNNADITMEECTFDLTGPTVYGFYGYAHNTPVFNNCTFNCNQIRPIANNGDALTVTGCTFNDQYHYSARIFENSGEKQTIVFTNNTIQGSNEKGEFEGINISKKGNTATVLGDFTIKGNTEGLKYRHHKNVTMSTNCIYDTDIDGFAFEKEN